MTYLKYFKGAVWAPAIILPLLLVADALLPPVTRFVAGEQFFQMYVLAFGVAGCFVFALWVSRIINKKTEAEVARLVWFAPIVFIPFYGVPWILYGVIYLVAGDVFGLGSMAYWLGFIPYFLIVGYFFRLQQELFI
ncbi:hypothetical protein [Pseudomonas extremaustralis]|uniref:hypothetical protein n=1 Tax=Pseudomonas extremaustralis TaxID=359110 RepID=UPI00099C8D7F|nr:hypothetical protein [Pseudomonas extremaustralis]